MRRHIQNICHPLEPLWCWEMVVPALPTPPCNLCLSFLSGLQTWLPFRAKRIEDSLLSKGRSLGAWDTPETKTFSPRTMISTRLSSGQQWGICLQIQSLDSECYFPFKFSLCEMQDIIKSKWRLSQLYFQGKDLIRPSEGEYVLMKWRPLKPRCLGWGYCRGYISFWLPTTIHGEKGMLGWGLDFLPDWTGTKSFAIPWDLFKSGTWPWWPLLTEMSS